MRVGVADLEGVCEPVIVRDGVIEGVLEGVRVREGVPDGD